MANRTSRGYPTSPSTANIYRCKSPGCTRMIDNDKTAGSHNPGFCVSCSYAQTQDKLNAQLNLTPVVHYAAPKQNDHRGQYDHNKGTRYVYHCSKCTNKIYPGQIDGKNLHGKCPKCYYGTSL